MSNIKFINKEQVLPESYIPTEHVVLCGNEISNYRYLISDSGFIPILIGQGEIPRIWLFAKTPKKEIVTLIDDSVSNLDQIKVDIFNTNKRIEIKDIQNGVVILTLDYKVTLIVNELDLRPLGYNIHGDSSKLVVGNSNISGNTFNGVNTIIGFGDKESKTSPNKI